MKISLPVKLGIFVILLFGVVIATCLLWTPLKIRYYIAKLRSDDPKKRLVAVDELLRMGEKGTDALALELDGGMKAAKLISEFWEVTNEELEEFENSHYALHTAAENGFIGAARLLIDKGIDVNALTFWGSGSMGEWELSIYETPLDVASNNKIRALLRAHGGKTAEELKEQEKKESGK